MRVGIIGCGYVFDHYMSTFRNHRGLELAGVTDVDRPRAEHVGQAYGLKVYASNEELLADSSIELVLNLTSIESHYNVTRAALLAGKHVYSEKPFTPDLESSRELMALARERGLRVSGAPSNAMSDTVQTMWRALRAGAVGKPRVVYAEFDDNPVYLMHPETWRSRTGAPWPYEHEYEAGCTYEHAGYYLSWLCAMFGPAQSVSAFSSCLVPDKAPGVNLDPPDTPDFSVACITFHSGVVARLTISIVATFDQRMRVIGDEGELSVNTYRDYYCPVRLERYSGLSLNARKARWVRENSLLQMLLGVGGRSVPLLSSGLRPSWLRRWKNPIAALKRMQLGQQDKSVGVAEMAAAIAAGREPWLSADFVLHVTELTLAISAAREGRVTSLETTFEPLKPLDFASDERRLKLQLKPGVLARLVEPILIRMHGS
ncbi:MAG: gfo/Idh/MocA family oxidoreductase [Phenylobacterium sp.]|uniref:Gfo/Idh/MocA family protein n=1 Tax=Phenylobacterium sp. TaxID=1871053 RepID=UPI0025FCB60C|nr:Gfo/Idh/MocA family oxidoreductase [Phenylobacterium sp.]MBA4011937.1 gfo/Idh/MocA family oxidoreductase [Phenylobacterium sp.]